MRFRQFFEDGTGALSMMRLVMFLVISVILIAFILENIASAYVAISRGYQPAIVDFAVQCVAVIALILTGKVVQSSIAEREAQ
jgi:hypothetical protein